MQAQSHEVVQERTHRKQLSHNGVTEVTTLFQGPSARYLLRRGSHVHGQRQIVVTATESSALLAPQSVLPGGVPCRSTRFALAEVRDLIAHLLPRPTSGDVVRRTPDGYSFLM